MPKDNEDNFSGFEVSGRIGEIMTATSLRRGTILRSLHYDRY